MLIIFYIIAYNYAYTSRKRNGYPFQYSCLKNPMDIGAWWATVHGVTRGRHDLEPKLLLLCLYLHLSKLLTFIQSTCVLFKLYIFFNISSRFYIFIFLAKIKKWEMQFSHKKEQNFVLCKNMDELESIILSKISQTRKDKCCMISHKEYKK